MLTKILKQENSDSIGVIASALCLAHCIATPFIFIIQSGSAYIENAPIWWESFDYLFIIISFLAVYWSAKNSSKSWVKYALWVSWILLSFLILNENLPFVHISEAFHYVPAASLIVLHYYNLRYCHCKGDKCCVIN